MAALTPGEGDESAATRVPSMSRKISFLSMGSRLFEFSNLGLKGHFPRSLLNELEVIGSIGEQHGNGGSEARLFDLLQVELNKELALLYGVTVLHMGLEEFTAKLNSVNADMDKDLVAAPALEADCVLGISQISDYRVNGSKNLTSRGLPVV